jgi:hypothetical protein
MSGKQTMTLSISAAATALSIAFNVKIQACEKGPVVR